MEEVEYRLILRDEFSKALQSADGHAQHLEGTMHGLKSAVAEFIGIYAAFEIGKEGIAAFEGLAKANAELEASLKSTHAVSGESVEDLKKQREELKKNSLSTETDIANMQSVLLTFTAVHKNVFKEASTAIEDMATKLNKGDLQGTAIQVGKALQDPIKGITALHKAGVNFSEAQKDIIKNLVNTGHAAKAQQLILHELETEFGGSAKAALDAAPMQALKNDWEEVLVTIGGALEDMLKSVEPYLKMIFQGIKDFVEFLQNHTAVIKFFAVVAAGIGTAMAFTAIKTAFAATTFGEFTLELGITTAAEYAMETAQVALNAAMDANPIGIVILAVTALAADIIYLKDQYDSLVASVTKQVDNAEQEYFKKEITSVRQLADEYDKLHTKKSRAAAEARAISEENAKIDSKMAEQFDLLKSGKISKEQFDNSATLAGTLKKNINNVFSDLSTKPSAKASGLGIADIKKSDKVSGNNHTIINVSIAKLVETLKIESQNIKDGATMGAEHVTRALIASVNQFQASIDT